MPCPGSVEGPERQTTQREKRRYSAIRSVTKQFDRYINYNAKYVTHRDRQAHLQHRFRGNATIQEKQETAIPGMRRIVPHSSVQKMAATGQQTKTKHFSQVSSRREELPRKVSTNPTANMRQTRTLNIQACDPEESPAASLDNSGQDLSYFQIFFHDSYTR